MKKLFAIVTIIACMFVAVAQAAGNSAAYLLDSLATFEQAQKFQQRLSNIAAKNTYSELDAELSIQYADIYIRLTEIALIELDAFTYGELRETGRLDDVINLIDQMRNLHGMGILTTDVLVETLADSIQNAANEIETIFSQIK